VYVVGISIFLLIISEIILILDILSEYFGIYIEVFSNYHIELEAFAVLSLGITLIIFGVGFKQLLHQNQNFRISLDLASGEFLGVVDGECRDWGLTKSECEVALLLIKGLTIKEIASLRKTTSGTIKSQSNAIYRKAGVKGRNELVAYFLEDLLCGQNLAIKKNTA